MSNTIVIGAAQEPQEAAPIINVSGQNYDLSRLWEAHAGITNAVLMGMRFPNDPKPFQELERNRKLFIGAATQLPPGLRDALRPMMIHAQTKMAEAAKQGIRLRMQAQERLLKRPTQTIPITFNSANFTANTGAQVVLRNPYTGSGVVYSGQALWAITGLETGALANVGSAGLKIVQANFAGHDYVNAALAAFVSTAGTANATTQAAWSTGAPGTIACGWDFAIFASDKRKQADNEFSPWNLQGAAGIIGSIMRETGQVTLGFQNSSGAAFGGTVHVHIKASLCGSPFSDDALRAAYVPMGEQAMAAGVLGLLQPAKLTQQMRQHTQVVAKGIMDQLESDAFSSIYLPDGGSY